VGGLVRAFVAAYPPPTVRAALGAVRDAVGPAADPTDTVRWTPPARWHVTLRFLGALERPDAHVAALATRLGGHPPVTVRLAGVGTFPAGDRGAVVWVGVDDAPGSPGIVDLAAAVAAVPGGDPPDPRPFRAHCTLARVAGSGAPLARALTHALAAHPAAGAPWTVTEVVLVASRPVAGAHAHEAVARIPLGA
jgi:2'-5' RNA ligase